MAFWLQHKINNLKQSALSSNMHVTIISNLNANYNGLLKFTPKKSNQITNPTNPLNVLKKTC